MASGDPVLEFREIVCPDDNYATYDFRESASTPKEEFPLHDFDPDASEYIDLFGRLSELYDGGGLTITLPWAASSAVAGDGTEVRWEAAFRRLADDADDMDASHSYSYNGVSDAPPSASGEITYPTIAVTEGADMDSLAAGECFVLRIYRDHDHADDDMAGDAELLTSRVSGKET